MLYRGWLTKGPGDKNSSRGFRSRILKLSLIGLGVFLIGGDESYASAQSLGCYQSELLHEIGYRLTSTQKDLLIGDQKTVLTAGLSRAELIQRIKERIEKVNPRPQGVQPRELAKEIVYVSSSFGLDAFVFASMIQKESTFNLNAVSPTGAVGLTQMTGAGLDELHHQYGHVSGEYSTGVPRALKRMSHDYFGFSAYLGWINWTKKSREYRPMLKVNLRYSLAAGASLLKVYLAVREGSYNQALQQYNGDKKKAEYARTIETWSQRVSYESCAEDLDFSSKVIAITCEYSDRPWLCLQQMRDGGIDL